MAKERAKNDSVKLSAAKGRPMLSWVGKRPLREVRGFPAQHIETFDPAQELGTPGAGEEWDDWPAKYPQGGLLFHGDNKEVLGHLLANGFRGRVDLIYIDPPFDSGADYVRRVSLRGPKGTAKLEGETYTLGEQIQYTDIWANDQYLQFMYERLLLLKELLSSNGSLYLHMDSSRGHQVKLICDEVFGAKAFQREIVWRIGWTSGYKSAASNWIRNHDTIFFYTKDPGRFVFNKQYIPYPPGYRRRDGLQPTGSGYPIEDTWNSTDLDRLDSIQIVSFSTEKLDFPTQKNEKLLERVLRASSNPGDLVLDCFIGSGTTAAVAQRFGRRWIGCDINKGAIQTTAKRLQALMDSQRAESAQGTLEEEQGPAQFSFTTWRVNDYDLQIQHNEAVQLACEHLGVERVKTDPFFDGTLGRDLVKVVPFSHLLTPLDLAAVERELESRPQEDRSVKVVCLGMELAAQNWVDDWNRLRKGRNSANRIEVIELRTDSRYGGFMEHHPSEATVDIRREGEEVIVEIKEFISPSILQRLSRETGLVKPHVDDWRSMVDSVMIDADYNGDVFNIVFSDVPSKKTDFVAGSYKLPASPKPEAVVAVKITDMLGEEVLVTSSNE